MTEQATTDRRTTGRRPRLLPIALILLVVVAVGGWIWWARAHSVVGVWRGPLLPATDVTVRLDGDGKAYAKLAVAGREIGDVAAGTWEGNSKEFTLSLNHSIPFVARQFRCRVVERQPDSLKLAVNDGEPQTWQKLPDDALPRP